MVRLLLRDARGARRGAFGGPLHELLHRGPGDPEEFGLDDLRISVDPDPDEGSTCFGVDEIVVHPDWFTAGPCLGNSKLRCLAPPHEDIALVFLSETVSSVDPAAARAGFLDELDVTAETFTVVEYGVDEFVTGSFFAPHAITIVDGIRSDQYL